MLRTTSLIALALTALTASAQRVTPIAYGDFNHWITRNIHESGVIGGKTRALYTPGPTATIDGNKPYTPAASNPWATSNVYARVHGINKGSCAVVPATRSGADRCACLKSEVQTVKVLGMVNMDVMVAGSMFLGRMLEPITSTSSPYSKMDMGVPFTGHPRALALDYKVEAPAGANSRVKASGFGSEKTLPGRDCPVVFVFLQRRWEDADGNIHARRVATGGQRFTGAADGTWHNAHAIPLRYGDASSLGSWLGLRASKANAYYARNSHGKMVPVIEEGWDTPDATPTHAIVMISAASGEPYVGTPGLTFYVDNVAFLN